MNPNDATKSDRALKLSEQGLSPAQIAERLGTNARSVSAMILAAKHRRAVQRAREAMQE
jgi:DNA-binding CsgD family transcriptional regulator